MPASTGARSLAAATARLRRAGRVSAPVALPVALTGSRLTVLEVPTDVGSEIADALDRLAESRGGGPAPTGAPRAAARATPLPYAVSPRATTRWPDGGVTSSDQSAVGDVGPGTRGPVPLAMPTERSGESTATRSGGAPWTSHAHVVAPSQGLRRTSVPLLAADAGGVASGGVADTLRHVGSAEPRPPRRSRGTAVRIGGNQATAELLRRLIAPETVATAGAPTAEGTPVAATRSFGTTDASPPEPWATAPTSHGAAPDPRPPQAPPRVGVGFAAADGWPAAAAPDTLAQAPVGLAGLVGWWEDLSEPAGGPPHRSGNPTMGGDETARGPKGFEPWTTPGALSHEELRDALGQLLREEALADGLEVDDGPA